MIKDAYYFSHDCNARNDEKILAVRMRHGAEGYGIYFMIIERLRESAGYMSIKDYNVIAFDLRVGADKVKSVIEDFGLFRFSDDEKHFFSPSLIYRMNQYDGVKQKSSIAGIKGNLIKNKHITKAEAAEMSDDEILLKNEQIKSSANATRPHPDRDPTARKEKEKKEKERKGEEEKETDHGFSASSAQKVLLSKKISIDQWAMKNHVSTQRIQDCIVEFTEFKERHQENTWKNESDLSKNFEFWLRSNAVPKATAKPQFSQNGNLRQPKIR